MSFMKSVGVILGTVKVWENKICEALPTKTILAICIIVVLNQLNAIKTDLTSIEWDVSSIQSDVWSLESDVSSIALELSFNR